MDSFQGRTDLDNIAPEHVFSICNLRLARMRIAMMVAILVAGVRSKMDILKGLREREIIVDEYNGCSSQLGYLLLIRR